MERLIVKNFGPLKDIDIELNKINLFIGENGSGKSVLAKIITIVLDFNESDDILKKFNEYNINYITKDSILKVYSEDSKEIYIQLKNKKILIDPELQKLNHKILEIQQLRKDGDEKLLNELQNLSEKEKIKTLKKIIKDYDLEFLTQVKSFLEITKDIDKLISQYIPAERNLISLFNKALTTLLVAEVPLPKFLLHFSSEFEKAGNELKELKFLNVKYVNGDGLDRHKVYFNDDNYLSLEHSSSGIQSALPLYLTVKYFVSKHSSIIIEEPEQNLFPKAQVETIKYIIEQVSDENSLFMMTHSPYVLSTLNILMMAHKVGNLNDKVKDEVEKFIPQSQWINRDDFSAYYLENGIARNIKGRTGLISENEIDEISDDMQSEFEELLSIYREHKNDK